MLQGERKQNNGFQRNGENILERISKEGFSNLKNDPSVDLRKSVSERGKSKCVGPDVILVQPDHIRPYRLKWGSSEISSVTGTP